MLQKFKSLFGAQDMTKGNPFACLLRFSIPLLIGNVAQMLYSTIDSIVVGKYCGDTALAAIGSSSPVQNMFLVFFIAIGTGVTIMVAQYFGARDKDNLGLAVGNAVTMIAIISVVLTAAVLPLARPILTAVKTPAETFEMACTYLTILVCGFFGTGFYNVLSGILRGLGDSVFPLIVLVCSSLLNIVLDILLVSTFSMGIAGAAYATIIAQILSACACGCRIISIRQRLNLKASCLRLRGGTVKTMLRLGVPTGLSMGILFFGIILLQTLVNSMGYMVTACITAVLKIDSFAALPSQTFSAAGSTFTGQNIGARQMDRVKQGVKALMTICGITTVLMVAVMVIFARPMMGLFTETEEIISLGFRIILVCLPIYFFSVISNCLSGVMTGAGDTMIAMWISIITHIVLRTPLAYLFCYLTRSELYPHGDPLMVFVSFDVAMLVAVIIAVTYFKKGRWMTKTVVKAEA